MLDKELKKLSRRELVDIIYQMKKNEEQLLEQIAALEENLHDKRIRIEEAGSIAEAAAEITNVFSVAQTTADLYLQEIACMKEKTEKDCAKMIDEAKQEAERILSAVKTQNEELRARYREDHKKWQQLRTEIQKLEELKMWIEQGDNV